MAKVQSVWGIDVGRCALKAVKLRIGAEDQVEVAAVDYVEHAKILSQPDADRHELIGHALEKFLSRNDISRDHVVVSVPGQHTLARFTKLPPVAPKRIPDIVRYEADQQIPFDMDEVIWDYQTFQQEGMPDIEVGIFAMKRELIREHLLHFEQASIEPIAVQSGPLAVYNAAQYDELLGGETTILLDIGAENTDLIIGTPHSLWTRTVPIGGNAFTEALVKSFKLSFSKAENLKRTAATSKYARQIFQAMRPIFADLVQELQRSIGFYSSTHRDASIEKVVVVGNAFLLPGLQKYLQQNLGLTVDRPEAFKKATPALPGGDAVLKEQLLSLYTAYGLALQGLELTRVNSNLLPTEIAKQVVWRRKRPAFAAAAACLVLAGGLVWFRQSMDSRALAVAATAPSLNLEQAAAIIQRGPSPSDPDRVKAQAVFAAGDTLKRELNRLSGQGATERRETEDLVDVMVNKTLVPRLFKTLYAALPTPEGSLGQAQTAEEFARAVQEGTVQPRGKRRQVSIQAVDMHFEPDLKLFSYRGPMDLGETIRDYDVNSPGEVPGMLIKIVGRSPNQGGVEFIRDEFMKPLKKLGRKPDMGFYFDKIALIEGAKVDLTPGRTPLAGRTPGGRGPGRSVTPAPGGVVAVSPETIDPLTLESMEDDWQFEIWVTAILEDLPEDHIEDEDRDDGEGDDADDGE